MRAHLLLQSALADMLSATSACRCCSQHHPQPRRAASVRHACPSSLAECTCRQAVTAHQPLQVTVRGTTCSPDGHHLRGMWAHLKLQIALADMLTAHHHLQATVHVITCGAISQTL